MKGKLLNLELRTVNCELRRRPTSQSRSLKDLQKRNAIGDIFTQVRNEKVVDFLQQHAKFEDVKPETTAPAAS